jgi:hypothetical protein
MIDTIKYINDLAKKNSEALSFIPLPRIEDYLRRGQILIQTENDDPCGFLIFGKERTIKVYQACIQYDARRKENGRILVDKLIALAKTKEASGISLWCAQDLDANEFWSECGFTKIKERDGGLRRGRKHNQWIMDIYSPLLKERA